MPSPEFAKQTHQAQLAELIEGKVAAKRPDEVLYMEVKERYAGISFTDVLWRFVESWKLVIIFAVLGLVLSVLYVRKNYAGLQEDYRLKKQESEKTWTEYRELLTATADYNAIAEQVQKGIVTASTQDAAAGMREPRERQQGV